MKNKLIAVLIIALMLTTSVSTVLGAEDSVITVFVDGNQLEFDVDPISENGRTLVPMRYIFEALGAEVRWIPEENKVFAQKDDITIEIPLDSNTMLRNGNPIVLDVPAKAINGRTLVPARAVAEALDATVEWNQAEYKVTITSVREVTAADGITISYTPRNTEEEMVTATVTAYISAVKNLDFSNAAIYTTEGNDESNSVDSIIAMAIAASTAELSESEAKLMESVLDPLIRNVLDITLRYVTFDVTDISKDESGYVITGRVKTPTTDNIQIMFNDLIDEETNEQISNEIFFELYVSGAITESSTEEDVLMAYLPLYVEKLTPFIEKTIESLPTAEQVGEMYVVNRDGRWLVDSRRSDITDMGFSSIIE